MSKYLDAQDVPIGLAAFLAYDDYDHISEPNHISATALLRPTRQIILGKRLTPDQRRESLYARLKARMGQAMHSAIQDVWENHRDYALKALGVPDAQIQRVIVNPPKDMDVSKLIPIYMEQREFRKVGNYSVSGKYDFIFDGQLQDFKFTSTFTYSKQTKAEDYIYQGSIYRWLNPSIVYRPTMAINYAFWDWAAGKAGAPNYPPKPVMKQEFPLQDPSHVESWILKKLNELERFDQSEDGEIPLCTDKDLWRNETTYKFFANPDKKARATKVFDTYNEAIAYQMNKGGKGVVEKFKSPPKACDYCAAKLICGQYKNFVNQGIIKES